MLCFIPVLTIQQPNFKIFYLNLIPTMEICRNIPFYHCDRLDCPTSVHDLYQVSMYSEGNLERT